MDNVTFQVPAEMKKQLEEYASLLNTSEDTLMQQAMADFLEEMEEYMRAKAVLDNFDSADGISLDAIEEKYGLNDE